MSEQQRDSTILVCGNPNSGKTTVFNGLTGSRQRVGNWPGVTVEMTAGSMMIAPPSLSMVTGHTPEPHSHSDSATAAAHIGAGHQHVQVVDLPGIYSLSASSEDEIIARDALMHAEHDLVVNVVDAANLERNLYLTLQLIEMRRPLLLVLTMTDLARSRGMHLDIDSLSEQLQCPVVAVDATTRQGIAAVRTAVAAALHEQRAAAQLVEYPAPLEDCLQRWSQRLVSSDSDQPARYTVLRLLEGDPYIEQTAEQNGSVTRSEVSERRGQLEQELGQELDIVVAEARYAAIQKLSSAVVQRKQTRESISHRIDRVALSRIWGLPIFFVAMYLVFWATVSVGGAFIDFFDIAVGTLVVDGLGGLLQSAGAPPWLMSILADGVGTGIQTVATFIPIIFMMFFMLSILEDSGYMARAAFVMDRVMRWVGLPGKAFVPLLVGFGCTVPAISATRTLETRNDRFMTIFMSPFMSCGARLPVYALFAAALFPQRAGTVVFSLYIIGMLLAILTGLLLKHTLFQGSYSHFVMELPPYHVPRLWAVMRLAGRRLRTFIVRAGITITIVVTLLAVLNTIGTDGSFGNQDSEESVLSAVGRGVTPVFTPMGIEQDNWPATVGLFTGLFAKEAIVGTLSSLYSQTDGQVNRDDGQMSSGDAAASADQLSGLGADIRDGLGEAVASIGTNLRDLGGALLDPLGTEIVAAPEGLEVDKSIFSSMRRRFSPPAGYAYLLFVLIYFPCVAALGAAIQEMGAKYGWLLAGYLTLLAWSIAVLVYQFTAGPDLVSVAAALGVLAGIYLLLRVLKFRIYRSRPERLS